MKYVINGKKTLSGSIHVCGNKNAALPCLVAVLLTEEEVILHNIPALEDVKVILRILEHLGVKLQKIGEHSYKLHAKTISSTHIPQALGQKIRASILFAGALLGRAKEASLPLPGGDVIGRRRLDTHYLALTALGATFSIKDTIALKAKKLVGTHVFQDEASVTSTENAIMAAVTAKGTTVIENAACEPHVQDVCNMLNSMGAKISGIGSNVLIIEGVDALGGCEFTIGPDFMEIGSFIGLAVSTNSRIAIHNIEAKHLRMIELVFAKLGARWTYDGDTILVSEKQTKKIVPDLGNAIPTISDAPWPGFPPDLTSIVLVLATQCEGTVLIHEKMFESRLYFTDKLLTMGARIVLCDPHRAIVNGPTNLIAATLSSPDVRAGMAMVIAALCAEGQSVIENIYQIERGYENLAKRLQLLGADIQKLR